MKINFDNETNVITIQDDHKRNNIITGASLIFCILASGWNLIHHLSKGFDFLNWFSLMSLIFLISAVIYRISFIVFKTTYQSQIKVEEIEYVKIKKIFKWKTFYFSLKNGKRREVMVTLNPNGFERLAEICNNFGIEMRPKQNL